MNDPLLVWVVMGLVLLAYALTGGADLGGGIWTLLARGPDAHEQRRAIRRAIAPIWEANHVWLIVLIVLMFAVFPRAFATLGIALHLPISLALVGLVLRGAAFVFGAYGLGAEEERARWHRTFAWSSAFTPLCLGAVLAAVASGAIRVEDGDVVSGWFAGWTTPFAAATGVLAAAVFALTAGAYLAVDAEPALRPRFARHARTAQIVVAVAAAAAAATALHDAPEFAAALFRSWAGPPIVLVALVAAVVAYRALGPGVGRTARPRLARAAVVVQVLCLVLGWGAGMDGHLVRPDLPLHAAGAHASTIGALVPVLGLGTLVLAPSLWYLLRVFRR